MRVTNNITTRQYLTNNNRELTQMLKSENRIYTQRRFNRVSEDPINGSKAMILRRQLRNLKIYNENLSTAKALFSAAETNLTSIAHDEYITVEEKLTAAANGSWSQQELDIFATELDEVAEQMVTTMNHDFSERELFGGTSNGRTPFRIERVMIKDDKTGKVVFPPDYNKYYNDDGSMKDGLTLLDIPRTVTYNGVPLDFDVTSDIICADGTTLAANTTGKSYTISVLDDEKKVWKAETQPITQKTVDDTIEKKDNSYLYPGSKPILVDIGLGIKYYDNYEVDPQTALDISMNGAKITGNGIEAKDAQVKFEYESSCASFENELSNVNENSYNSLLSEVNTLIGKFIYAKNNGNQAVPKADIERLEKLTGAKITENTTAGGVSYSADIFDITEYVDVDAAAVKITQNGNEKNIGGLLLTAIKTSKTPKQYDIKIGNDTLTLSVEAINTTGDPELDIKKANEALNSAFKKALKGKGYKEDEYSLSYNGRTLKITSETKLNIESTDMKLNKGESDIVIEDRYSKNLMQLVLDAAVACRRGRQDTVNAIIDRANEANNKILTEITTLGAKQNSIDFYVEKNRDYEFDLKERQNLVEGTDMEEEIIRYEAIKAAYDATLKMGADILPHSIFDFIS